MALQTSRLMTPLPGRTLLIRQWPHLFRNSDRVLRSEFSEQPDELGFKIELSLRLMCCLSDYLCRPLDLPAIILGLRSFFRPACGRADRSFVITSSFLHLDFTESSPSEIFNTLLRSLILIFYDLKSTSIDYEKILKTSEFIAPCSVRATRRSVARALKALECSTTVGSGFPHVCSAAKYCDFLGLSETFEL